MTKYYDKIANKSERFQMNSETTHMHSFWTMQHAWRNGDSESLSHSVLAPQIIIDVSSLCSESKSVYSVHSRAVQYYVFMFVSLVHGDVILNIQMHSFTAAMVNPSD